MTGQKKVYRYSLSFKQKVVSEIESGDLSIEGARRRYGIKGWTTIQKWMKHMGKDHLLSRVVIIQTPEDMTELERLKRRNKELESALVHTQLQCLSAEAALSLACETLGVEVEAFKKKRHAALRSDDQPTRR